MCRKAGIKIWEHIFGWPAVLHPKNCKAKKRSKFRIEISKIVKAKKIGELWSTGKKVTGAHVDSPKINTARAV